MAREFTQPRCNECPHDGHTYWASAPTECGRTTHKHTTQASSAGPASAGCEEACNNHSGVTGAGSPPGTSASCVGATDPPSAGDDRTETTDRAGSSGNGRGAGAMQGDGLVRLHKRGWFGDPSDAMCAGDRCRPWDVPQMPLFILDRPSVVFLYWTGPQRC